MKKLLFLAFAFALITAVGCKKDEDSFEDKLKGLWYVTLIDYQNCPDPEDNETISLPSSCDGDNCITFDFSSNGGLDLFSKQDGDVESSTGSWSGDEDALTLCNDGDCITGQLEFDGKEATMTYQEDGCDVTFVMTKD